MEKIPTIFVRDWGGNPKHVTREPNPECAWVFEGIGLPTRKFDGTCMMFDGQRWWARREVKKGKQPPADFRMLATDEETGKTVGWEPVEQSGFAKLMPEALNWSGTGLIPGTYELCGPKINKNPEKFDHHVLLAHAEAQDFEDVPLDYDGLAAWLHGHPYEGIVWHRTPGDPNTQMAKIKARDFQQVNRG